MLIWAAESVIHWLTSGNLTDYLVWCSGYGNAAKKMPALQSCCLTSSQIVDLSPADIIISTNQQMMLCK